MKAPARIGGSIEAKRPQSFMLICTLETQGLAKFQPVAFLALSANKRQLLSTACNYFFFFGIISVNLVLLYPRSSYVFS